MDKNKNMVKLICASILISCGLLTSCGKTDETILKKTISRLNSIEKIEYQVIFKILQKEKGMDEIDTANCYFDFTSKDSLIGSRYNFKIKHVEQVYDGKKTFQVNSKTRNIIYTNHAKINQVISSMFFTNSIYIVRKILPEILIDTTSVISRQNDTIINGKKNFSFKISVRDKNRYNRLGAIATEIRGETADYNLCISKQNYLPTYFKYVFQNNGYWKATFSKINLSASRSDSIWDFDRFPKEYLRMSSKEWAESLRAKASIKIGSSAPSWSLPSVSGDSISLSNFKKNLVLLEFWFPYCGGCIQAIPEINKIQDNYLNKNLKVFGIEFTQPDAKIIKEYCEKQNIKYPTLYKGQAVSQEYGVNAAPTFFLINRGGLIVYTSIGLDSEGLIKAIEENLK